MRKILFVDRDGTILVEPEDKQIDSLEKFAFVDGAIEALTSFRKAGWDLVLISNQDGLGTESFPEDEFQKPQNLMLQILKSCGVEFLQILICPHWDSDRCLCRKPQTGLLLPLLEEGFDRSMSAVVGDRASDLRLAEALGVQGFLISKSDNWRRITQELLTRSRRAVFTRKTKETDCKLMINLDEYFPPEIETGSPFFDHMLEQIAFHAQIGIQLSMKGDWVVDDHHCIEDSALCLGTCLRKALGNKHGISRFGFLLPMDESKSEVCLDLSGRSYSLFEAPFTRESVGGIACEMIPHFFRSLAEGLGATLHIKITGENNHHLIEAGFKGFGRCLGQAIRKGENQIPSSKGVL